MFARLRCGGNLPLCLAFGTGEGHLWYGICVPCSKRLPGVRDAFSEAFGVKNRLLRYGKGIRCMKTPFSARKAFSEELGAQNRLLWYGTHLQRPAELPTPQTVDSLLPHRTHLQCAKLPRSDVSRHKKKEGDL